MTPEEKTQTSEIKNQKTEMDTVSFVLYLVGVLIIIGMSIAGFYILDSSNDTLSQSYDYLYLFSPIECFASGLFYGLVLIGIGRIIQVIQKNK